MLPYYDKDVLNRDEPAAYSGLSLYFVPTKYQTSWSVLDMTGRQRRSGGHGKTSTRVTVVS